MYLEALGGAEGTGVPELEPFCASPLAMVLPTVEPLVGGGRTKADIARLREGGS